MVTPPWAGLRRLRVTTRPSSGPSQVFIAPEHERRVTLGSSADVTVQLTDPTVSRYHVELVQGSEGLEVRDLESKNGTWYGTLRLSRATVRVPIHLRLGELEIDVDEADVHPTAEVGVEPIAGMVASCPVSLEVVRMVRLLAPTALSVLVHGETGTGKELVARAMHDLSTRASGPFVTVDCGALPPTLVASELFGHERGAFTGADRKHVGAFERAHGGTVFLDEIGELPLAVQPMLLGVLQRRRFRRVGGDKEIEVDVRVVSATHRDLRADANRETFRSDLYFRLAAGRIDVPPLRERLDDLEELIASFVREVSGRADHHVFGPAAIAAMRAQRWSGNVRELRNVVERALALGQVSFDTGLDTPERASVAGASGEQLLPYSEARADALARFEKEYLERLVAFAGDNVSEAARLAKMDRPWLGQLLRRHGLRR